MKFAYPLQVPVYHVLRMKVIQAADDVYELRAGVTRETSEKKSP
jgi:hypothetical protein